jgi:NAD(P)-dependent dehydrogenase (short-subunit alcohol dehydrogenase family)
MNHGRLHGKRCLITGAARGIGASAARLFAREGASVVLFDLKDELGAQVVADIVKAGGKASYQNCDVTQLTKVSVAVEAAVQFLGGIDVLFNNAGTCLEGDVEKLSEADWDRTFAINVKSMFLCSKFVVPIMRHGGGGSIINMGSESGLIGFPMHPAYCASKGAAEGTSARARNRGGHCLRGLVPGVGRVALHDRIAIHHRWRLHGEITHS